jgi:hypothetical protein
MRWRTVMGVIGLPSRSSRSCHDAPVPFERLKKAHRVLCLSEQCTEKIKKPMFSTQAVSCHPQLYSSFVPDDTRICRDREAPKQNPVLAIQPRMRNLDDERQHAKGAVASTHPPSFRLQSAFCRPQHRRSRSPPVHNTKILSGQLLSTTPLSAAIHAAYWTPPIRGENGQASP